MPNSNVIDDPTEVTDPLETLEVLIVDPNEVDLERNVRDTVDTESEKFADLVASIREHGVLQAVSALRYSDGTIRVVHGQRRVLAARQAGAALPVVVAPDTATTEKQRVFDRITGQIDENDVRAEITDGQRSAGLFEMLELKIPQNKIMKRLRLKREELKARAKIGSSQIARQALDSGQLDFDRAVVVAAFESEGDSDAVARLMDAPAYEFRYVANCILAEREEARERADAAAPWTQRGFTILATDPDTSGEGWMHVDRLEHVETGEPATVEVVDADPSLWAVYLTVDEGGLVVVDDTSEVIDPHLVDWSTEGTDPDVEPAEGRYRVDAVTISDAWVPDYYILDPAAAGLRPAATSDDDGDDAGDGDAVSVAERLEAEQRERERAERRKVIKLNRLGAAAKATRIEWLTGYLTRKTPPTSASRFVAESLAADALLLNQNRGKSTAVELLGIDADKLSTRAGLDAFVENLTPNRANVIVLALVLGAFEARCDKDYWRPHPYSNTGIPDYLHFLADIGYSLTPIDLVAAGDLDADEVDAESGTDVSQDLAA